MVQMTEIVHEYGFPPAEFDALKHSLNPKYKKSSPAAPPLPPNKQKPMANYHTGYYGYQPQRGHAYNGRSTHSSSVSSYGSAPKSSASSSRHSQKSSKASSISSTGSYAPTNVTGRRDSYDVEHSPGPHYFNSGQCKWDRQSKYIRDPESLEGRGRSGVATNNSYRGGGSQAGKEIVPYRRGPVHDHGDPYHDDGSMLPKDSNCSILPSQSASNVSSRHSAPRSERSSLSYRPRGDNQFRRVNSAPQPYAGSQYGGYGWAHGGHQAYDLGSGYVTEERAPRR